MGRPVFILRAGQAPAEVAARRGDFPRWIEDAAEGAHDGAWETRDLRTDDPLPALSEGAAWIVTGSASSVTERAPWMLRAEARLREGVAAGVPVLGVCFGHQMLAQALGGLVEKNPRGRELGTVPLERTDGADPLLAELPRSFAVNASHVDSVTRLPEGARILATTRLEPVAAFAVGACAWGVQFHPEFDGDIVRGYVRARAAMLEAEGLSPSMALESAADTPLARDLVRRFVSLPEVKRRV